MAYSVLQTYEHRLMEVKKKLKRHRTQLGSPMISGEHKENIRSAWITVRGQDTSEK